MDRFKGYSKIQGRTGQIGRSGPSNYPRFGVNVLTGASSPFANILKIQPFLEFTTSSF
jgi:hypothetical protein